MANNPLLNKVALDALLEMINDEDYAIHQHHSDPDFTPQNGKMMGKGTETEQGALDTAAIPASSMIATPRNITITSGNYQIDGKGLDAYKYAVSKCAACECGDCFMHTAASVHTLTNQVVPGVTGEPTVEDATFFKEGESDFEVSRVAGKVVVADTKSYGAGTPIGGTPNSAAPSSTPAAPGTPPANTPASANLPSSSQLTPEQLAQKAQNPAMSNGQAQPGQQPGQMPVPGQPLNPLAELTNMTAKLRLACAVAKEFAPAIGTVVRACSESLEMAGYTVRTATQKLSSAGVSEGLMLIVAHKNGSAVDVKDIARRVNGAVNPDYFVRTADIAMKPTPKMLPPRDDMRRHIDETAQDEVMEGVKEPTPSPAAPAPAVQAQPQAPVPMTPQQQLLSTTLASDKTATVWDEDDDDDDDEDDYGPVSDSGTLYGKPIGRNSPPPSGLFGNGRLRDLDPTPVRGYPLYLPCRERNCTFNTKECGEENGYGDGPDKCLMQHYETAHPGKTPNKKFRTTKGDKDFLKSIGIKAKKANLHATDVKCSECGEPVEEGVCSGCGDPISTHCDANISAVMCQDCGKWFGNVCGCMDKDPGGNVCNACLAQPRNKHRIASIQTEEGVNPVCPGCASSDLKKFEESSAENGSLVECNDCGCFFAL